MDRPIYDTIIKYSRDAGYPWHMPGHKRGRGTPVDAVWQDIDSMDFTEIPGLDEYHCPEGIINEAQQQASELYGTKNSYLLVNGSTVGILAAVSAVCRRHSRILIARNCHKAVYNAVELMELRPAYLCPEWLSDWDIYGGIAPEQVEEKLKQYKDIQAVVLTSPTYEGVVSDIQRIAHIVHSYGAVLIVDEAHGAHLPFIKGLPDSAVVCGADLVIQSLHKTLPAMTQTAILHRCSDLVEAERLFHYISLYQSTSPSYVMLANMDYAIHYMAKATKHIRAYMEALSAFRQRAAGLSCIRLLDWKDITGSCAIGYDDAKLVLSVKHFLRDGVTGTWLSKQLSKRGHLVEMSGCSYSLCMSTVMDSVEAFQGLAETLEEIDAELKTSQFQTEAVGTAAVADSMSRYAQDADFIKDFKITDCVPSDDNIIRSIAQVFDEEKLWLPMEHCVGYVAGAYVYAYPPGSPLVVPGERITGETISLITFYLQAGLKMNGIRDGCLCVLSV